eukprot:4464991-Prymnesium_polylepis.1
MPNAPETRSHAHTSLLCPGVSPEVAPLSPEVAPLESGALPNTHPMRLPHESVLFFTLLHSAGIRVVHAVR